MPHRTLLLYSTTDGHTVTICKHIRDALVVAGHEVEINDIRQPSTRPLADWDTIVIGASIRYGKHQPVVTRFIAEHGALLASKRNAFFSVNAVARKPHKRSAETNPYVRKFLRRIAWQPEIVAVFGGRLAYQSYGLVDRTMIRFIMWLTKGPTARDTVVDFTDWEEVTLFARRLADPDAKG